MKKSDKLLAKLGESLSAKSAAPAAGREPVASPPQAPRRKTAPRKKAKPAPAAKASPPPPAPKPAPAPSIAGPLPADTVINRHVAYALGAGLIPLPVFDVLTIAGVQLKLIADLSQLYGIPFARNQAKAIIGALVGGAGSLSLATTTMASLAKTVPGAGSLLGASALPLSAGALTFAIGRVFKEHFESGGTLLDFDTEAAKAKFNALVEEGRTRVGWK